MLGTQTHMNVLITSLCSCSFILLILFFALLFVLCILFVEVVLCEWINDRVNEVKHHSNDEVLPYLGDERPCLIFNLLSKECFLLLCDGTLKHTLNSGAHSLQYLEDDVHLMLAEAEYHEEALYKSVNPHAITQLRVFLTWIETLTIALPMKVAPKNTPKGTRKCPHKNPARSNRGFGT